MYPHGPRQYVGGPLGTQFFDDNADRILREEKYATGNKFHRVHDKKIRRDKRFIKFLNATEIDCEYSFLDATGVSPTHPVVKKMNKLGLIVIPHDDPIEGKFGFLISDSDLDVHRERGAAKEATLYLHGSLYPGTSIQQYNEAEKIQTAYTDALERNYLIVRSDIPKELIVGFVVVKGDGSWYHFIKRSELEDIWSPPTDEQRQKAMDKKFPEPEGDYEKMVDKLVGKIYQERRGDYAGILKHNTPGTEYTVPSSKRLRSQIHADRRYTIAWTYIKDTRGGRRIDQLYLTAEDVMSLVDTKQWTLLPQDEFDSESYKLDRLRRRKEQVEEQKKAWGQK